MANHCYNYIEFRGETEHIKKLARCFSLLMKVEYAPTFIEACASVFQLLEVPEDAEYNYFGTKWFEVELSQEPQLEYDYTDEDTKERFSESYFIVSGDSAWTPPEKLTQELCKAYRVRARHEYEESGCDFAGILTIDEKGDYDEEEYTYRECKYKYDQDWWWDEMVYTIQERHYETFEEFFEDNGYAELGILKEAWKIAHEKES
tara:strand:- start:1379 stop:1990 length:612 start_codon:yes stop_codon:yes gene_type:complete